jgi:hypothetical protein
MVIVICNLGPAQEVLQGPTLFLTGQSQFWLPMGNPYRETGLSDSRFHKNSSRKGGVKDSQFLEMVSLSNMCNFNALAQDIGSDTVQCEEIAVTAHSQTHDST